MKKIESFEAQKVENRHGNILTNTSVVYSVVKLSDHEDAIREKDEELRRTKGYLSKMSDMYSTLNINYNNLDVEKTKITSENTKLRELLDRVEQYWEYTKQDPFHPIIEDIKTLKTNEDDLSNYK